MLEGNTRGYTKHPQLHRFRTHQDPIAAINLYLSYVLEEAVHRSYLFDREKIAWEHCTQDCPVIKVTLGQMEYEAEHLLAKLKARDPKKFIEVSQQAVLLPHPLFEVILGGVEDWEVTK